MNSLIKNLEHLIGSRNVLTDREDLYVYSFEGEFGFKRCYSPSIVVKASSDDEVNKVIKLLKDADVQVIRRGGEHGGRFSSTEPGRPTVLIDSTRPIEAENLREMLREAGEGGRPSPPAPSLLELLTSHHRARLIYRCNECSFCSGYCTLGPFLDGGETYSSKGRLILSRGLFNGEIPPSEKLVDSLYTCSTCGQCYDQCTSESLEIEKAVIRARHEVAMKGRAPEIFRNLPRFISENGNPMGTPAEDRVFLFEEAADEHAFDGNDVLYWAGCTASYRLPGIVESTVDLLHRAGVDFGLLGEREGCCGEVLYLVGLWDEARENAVKTAERISESGAGSLITSCAGCYYTFTHLYPEVFGVNVSIPVFHTSQFIDHLIEENGISLRGLDMSVTWHDPCDLGRHSRVYDPPRSVLKAIPRLRFVEMPLNREHGRCCGAGGGLWAYNMDVATRVAHAELTEDVLPLGIEAVVTGCPACYMNLRYVAQLHGMEIEVLDLAELITKSL